jgi:hypothetical protein
MRKICLSAPGGVPEVATPGVGIGFQECDVPVFVSVVWLLSPLFYQDAQISIFPAPISYLGESGMRQLLFFRQGPVPGAPETLLSVLVLASCAKLGDVPFHAISPPDGFYKKRAF